MNFNEISRENAFYDNITIRKNPREKIQFWKNHKGWGGQYPHNRLFVCLKSRVTLCCYNYRSYQNVIIRSRLQMSYKIGVVKNFRRIHRKTPALDIFLIRLQAFRPVPLSKSESSAGAFPGDSFCFYHRTKRYLLKNSTSLSHYWHIKHIHRLRRQIVLI